MTRFRLSRLLVLAFAVLAAGCVSENKDKIEGTRWTSNAGSIKIKSPGANMGKSVYVPAGFMELHFHKDGSLFYIIGGKLYSGKYSLGVGQSVIFHLEEPLAGSKTHNEKIIIVGSRLTMTDTDGTQLTFSKVN